MPFWLWCLLIFCFLSLVCIKIYAKVTCGRYDIRENLSSMVVLITGCTAGIGKVVAFEFAKHGAKVYMAARNVAMAEAIAQGIRDATGSARVFVLQCDLSSLRSVRECAEAFLATGDPLHILINNAGLARDARKHVTEDGLEEIMASNHFGHFLLTNLLLDKLRASKPSRIVVLSSIMHRYGKLDTTDLNYDRRDYVGPQQAYNDSKLANVLFARELARRLYATGVTSNAVHPGAVRTDIYRRVPFHLQPILQFLLLFFKSAHEGAEAVLHAALAPELDHVSGHYLWDNKPAAMTLKALDDHLAKELWEKSADCVGLGIPKGR